MSKLNELDFLKTEKINPKTESIDLLSTGEMLALINELDGEVSGKIRSEIKSITEAVDLIYPKLMSGGRLIYVGAGTSGRLACVDAAECPPTFGVDDKMFTAVMAGGNEAFFKASEGAEDNKLQGREDLHKLLLKGDDVVFAISSSGRTPYCIGALEYAKENKISTIGLACNKNSLIGMLADIAIEIDTGPEVISGSTRMKAGTAQKMVLNMISTTVMIKTGRVYKNLMVNVKATNEKLIRRTARIFSHATGILDENVISRYLTENDYDLKVAIVSALAGVSGEEALALLNENQGLIRKAIKNGGRIK